MISVDHNKLIEIFDMKHNHISFMDYLLGNLSTSARPQIIELFAYVLHRLYVSNNSLALRILGSLPLLQTIIQEEGDNRNTALVIIPHTQSQIISILGDLVRLSDPMQIIKSDVIDTCLRIFEELNHNVTMIFSETFSYLMLQISFIDCQEVQDTVYFSSLWKIVGYFPMILELYHFLKNIDCAFYLFLTITSFARRIP